jgi:hypothetical protein
MLFLDICKGKGTIFFMFFRDISRFAVMTEHKYCFKLISKMAINFCFLNNPNAKWREVSNHVPYWFEKSKGDTDLHKPTPLKKC